MTLDKTGRIIWHDLFTTDTQRSMTFYQRVAGWSYEIEHATDFAWGGGEKDFILALSGDEAGAGFTDTPPELSNGWVAYVEVDDVDAALTRAERLGGTIIRKPFEVPGVGRNALLRDPLGAILGISLSRHSFPVPQRQFDVEIYLTNGSEFPKAFYAQLFDWKISSPPVGEQTGEVIVGPSGENVAIHLLGKSPTEAPAVWMPSIKVPNSPASLSDVEALGGEFFNQSLVQGMQQFGSPLRDPDGALSFLLKA